MRNAGGMGSTEGGLLQTFSGEFDKNAQGLARGSTPTHVQSRVLSEESLARPRHDDEGLAGANSRRRNAGIADENLFELALYVCRGTSTSFSLKFGV